MIRTPPLSVIALLVFTALALALVPLMGGPYAVKFLTRVMALGLFVMSLDLLIGVTGLVSFGHAAFFGLGAYTVYLVSPKDEAANLFIAFGAAKLVAGLAALLIGLVVVRTKGFYFIMVTLAASQMLYALFHDTRIAGGSDGASIAAQPDLTIGATTLLDTSRSLHLYYLALAALVVSYLFLLWLVQTPFGRVLQGIRWNETRMSALGFNTHGHKLAAFVLAGMVAGAAGALFACIDGYVPPELLSWRESGLAIMMVVLGGTGTLFGSVFGALIYALAEEVLKSASLVGPFIADHWAIPMGLFLIAAVLAAPRGLLGWLPQRRPAPLPDTGDPDRPPRTTATLSVDNVSKRFGGLVASDNLTMTFTPNRIHAIIGPNGAGKTTFTNLLTGALKPSGGHIRLDGDDITRLPAHARARLGLGRSFQRTTIVPAFSVADNCAIAAQARRPQVLRLLPTGEDEARAVHFALHATGLIDRATTLASALSHGEQRQLEIAMLIASGAKILLLDEPLAGTGPEETRRVTALLKDLTRDHTIILIEHDMDAVFAVADTVSVLVAGRLIATGTPDAIKADAKVREAYLGDYGAKA